MSQYGWQPPHPPHPQQQPHPPPYQHRPPRKRTNPLVPLLVVAAILVVLGGAGGAAYYWFVVRSKVDRDLLVATVQQGCGLASAGVVARLVPDAELKDPRDPLLNPTSGSFNCRWASRGEYPGREVFLSAVGYTDLDRTGSQYDSEKEQNASKSDRTFTDVTGATKYSAPEDVDGIGQAAYAQSAVTTGGRAKATSVRLVFYDGPYFVRVTYQGFDLKPGGDASVPADRGLVPEAEVLAGARAVAENVAGELAPPR